MIPFARALDALGEAMPRQGVAAELLWRLCTEEGPPADLWGQACEAHQGEPDAPPSGLDALCEALRGPLLTAELADLGPLLARWLACPPGASAGRRKGTGAVHTPPWLAGWLAEQTLGRRLGELRQAEGLPEAPRPEHAPALRAHAEALGRLAVLDPACGAGALLVPALHLLRREHAWVRDAAARLGLSPPPLPQLPGLFGVDRDPAAAALTRLVLWRAAGRPPPELLSRQIRCADGLRFDPVALWSREGFDVVLANPPYVKLQDLHRHDPEQAAWLRESGRFQSTGRGNPDLYLPFLERGLELLLPQGRLGLLAPGLWLMNRHGQPLRTWLARVRHLERWLDFGDQQVFEGATTYTAAQLFAARPQRAVRFARWDGHRPPRVDWEATDALDYEALPAQGPWRFLPAGEEALIRRLQHAHPPLHEHADRGAVGFRGIESGADEFFHLDRLGPGRYRGARRGARADLRGVEVALEDALLRPLVSTRDARRFVLPRVRRHAIVPYALEHDRHALLSAEVLAARHPLTWAWFRAHEQELRQRDRGAMDREDGWWGFTRPMNLALQGRPKLGVAQTARRLQVFFDVDGASCFNNVRVGGVLPRTAEEGWYLLGVLNAPVSTWLLRRTARPKQGGYLEANKQFLGPLPVPEAPPDARAAVAAEARALQHLHTLAVADPSEARARTAEITRRERALADLVHDLFGLGAAERRRVKADGPTPGPPEALLSPAGCSG